MLSLLQKRLPLTFARIQGVLGAFRGLDSVVFVCMQTLLWRGLVFSLLGAPCLCPGKLLMLPRRPLRLGWRVGGMPAPAVRHCLRPPGKGQTPATSCLSRAGPRGPARSKGSVLCLPSHKRLGAQGRGRG